FSAARAAAEIRSENKVSAADEILNVGLPLDGMLPVGICPEEKQRRELVAGLAAFGLVHQPGNFQAVEALVFEEFRPDEEIRIAERSLLMIRNLAWSAARRRYGPDVARHRRIGVIEKNLVALVRPHVRPARLPGGG